ncbi:organic hydroperoxide resistance protein [Deinococcus maricopensis]|uniref:Peroxiredoxin, Ohr subfamily n=1 Tax=Deinococcus maricopensis (strain DSM 21211 / LMG 22137 / NRRL B-23946 / LB-34) TaxID=709986 RepID=E8UA80_DEIML|nr:organic hydroperoxide resistance protein [Deinococcus maricopensis]ADV67969.1 peroxiredoxin, Ohr subfamily [Deinococcus maricopensis DSM 21211]
MSNLYTAEATATGGRAGHARTSDGRLDVDLSVPSEIGGDGGTGTNPEQLFAAGYAACFQGALGVAARRQKVSADNSEVTAKVGLEKEGLGFKLNVEIAVRLPGVERDVAEKLVHAAHEVCPYSNATRGNIDVRLSVID